MLRSIASLKIFRMIFFSPRTPLRGFPGKMTRHIAVGDSGRHPDMTGHFPIHKRHKKL
jgi:hypothetical protein